MPVILLDILLDIFTLQPRNCQVIKTISVWQDETFYSMTGVPRVPRDGPASDGSLAGGEASQAVGMGMNYG